VEIQRSTTEMIKHPANFVPCSLVVLVTVDPMNYFFILASGVTGSSGNYSWGVTETTLSTVSIDQ